MATTYSTLYAANSDGSGTYAYRGPSGGRGGETYTVIGATPALTASSATDDIVNLFPLPAGAKITRYSHWYTDHGTTATATIEADTTDMKASIALGTAVLQSAQTALSDAELGAGNLAAASAQKTIRLLFTEIATPTAGAVYNFVATIAMPNG